MGRINHKRLFLYFHTQASLSLLLVRFKVLLPSDVLSLDRECLLDNFCVQSVIPCELITVFRPRDFGQEFSIPDWLRVFRIRPMVYLRNLLRKGLFFGSENPVSLERVLWRTNLTFVRKEELVILGPKFVILHQQQVRVNLWLALRMLFPPLGRRRILRVVWEGLAMDTDRLLTELCRVFFNHLAPASFRNLRFSQCGLVLLSHPQVALLSFIESLFSIFMGLKIVFQLLQSC